MNAVVVIWILAVVVAVLVGCEVGRWLCGQNAKLVAKKRAARVLSGKLRAKGLKLIPDCIDAFVDGAAQDMVEKIHGVGKLIESGSDAIEKEIDKAVENVLAAKLATPDGRAAIKMQIVALEPDLPLTGTAAPVRAL
ncbi:MAG: hypothetical protein ACYDH4_10535 [Candidatus Cryosericum sp.]